MVCTKAGETARNLMDYLKEEFLLSDSGVKKIICLADYKDVDESFDLLGK